MDLAALPAGSKIAGLVSSARMLVIDDDYSMRKVIRSLLLAIGIKDVHEAESGRDGLHAIPDIHPDIVVLDWEMPNMTGGQFMRILRAPATYPAPDVPVIMLTGHVERERVLEAMRLGVNEFLCKPVSAKSLQQRILAIRANPRPMVRIGDYYGPEPRKALPDGRQAAGDLVWV